MRKMLRIFLCTMLILGSLTLPVRAGMVEDTAETTLHRPLNLDLVEEYLRRWNIHDLRRESGSVVFVLRYNGNNHEFRLRESSGRLLLIRLEDFFSLPKNHLRFAQVLSALMTENYQLPVGKFTWDDRDGEVGIEHSIVAVHGLAYDDFVDVMIRLLLIADVKYPEFMRIMWR